MTEEGKKKKAKNLSILPNQLQNISHRDKVPFLFLKTFEIKS